VEDSWLDIDALDEWVEVIDPSGDPLGFLRRAEASKLNLDTQIIETPERYLSDPYILYNAQLAYERGIISRGQDLNDVQIILLGSHIIKQREADKFERERNFNERFFTANPEGYQAYKEHKERQEAAEGDVADVEQRVPRSIEEFLATLSAFSEDEGETQDKGQEKVEGWLASFLDDSDLDQMSEE
jgi:hypothetical protein